MSFVPNQNDVDQQVDVSMRMFESAQVGPAATVPTQRAERILVCLDGSQQDDAAIAAALFLRSKYERCRVLVVDARERDRVAQYATERAAQIGDAEWVEVAPHDSYDRILAAVGAAHADLVIVPCPFGRDFESVGVDSAGTVVDVLLCRCPVPMLVIRRSDQPLEQATRELAMVVSGEMNSAPSAIGWAVGMAAKDALFHLDLVLEREQFENLTELLRVLAPQETLDRQRLEAAVTETHAHLHAQLAQATSAAGLRYRLRPKVGETESLAASEASRPSLVVLPLDEDGHHGHGFVQDRIRRSPHPVLVVPNRPGQEPRGDCLQ